MKTSKELYIKNLKVGYYASILLSIITFLTFALALTAIPNSGAFCPGNCFEYPYLDTLSEYPGDYYWMYFAIILMFTFLIYVISIHSYTDEKYKIYSRIAFGFALLSTFVLVLCYFIQCTVVPASLLKNQAEGISLWTQYNPHGLFIALEELGYIFMSITFFFMAILFSGKNKLEKAIRWIYFLAFGITLLSFIGIAVIYGMDKQDRFEVVVISINWLVLIINGILSWIYFRRNLMIKPPSD